MAVQFRCDGCNKYVGFKTVGLGERLLCDTCRAASPLEAIRPAEAESSVHIDEIEAPGRRYGVARFIFSAINVLSWIGTILSLVLFQVHYAIAAISGIAVSQLGIIFIDTEYNTRESAAYLKHLIEISRSRGKEGS